MQRGHWWKLLGLAGAMGVAATGALAVRAERARRAYSPDEVRERLHARHAQAYVRHTESSEVTRAPVRGTLRHRIGELLHRRRNH